MLPPVAPGPEAGKIIYFLARVKVHDKLRMLRDGDARVGCRRMDVGLVVEGQEQIYSSQEFAFIKGRILELLH